TFGGLQTEVVGGVRVRTENNCVPRDIVSVGDVLLFGYNVFLGMRSETNVSDVFSLHRLVESGGSYEVEDLSLSGTFLDDPVFVRSFKELYQYYKSARLLQLRHLTGKLLAIFLVGDTLRDIKVFRWRVDVEGNVSYIDDRGERDHVFPKRHDFEWVETTREMHVLGRHPHIAIDDLLFVETVGGDLTIKVENNTEDGLGIYREPVDDRTQSLADARIFYAKVGVCYLLKILPYNESAWRYLVFNTRNQQVDRIDAIGASCVQLPEDHGLIYPGGYYLRSGETKSFDGDFSSLYFKRQIKSPNGEDVLYVFDDVEEGRYVLFTYNMIRKELAPPIGCHGYSLFDDGLLVVFRADSLEPTRNHNMQLWRTPFQSDSVAAKMPTDGSYLAKIGNAELVRGISDAYSICRMIDNQSPSMAIYEDLIAATTRVLDAYHWFKHADAGDIASTIKEVRQTAELVIDEFEKVQAIQQRANEALTEAETAQRDLSRTLRPDSWERIDQFVDALASLRKQRGRLITMRDMRYVDLGRIDEMEAQVAEQVALISERTVAFLLRDDALVPYLSEIESQTASIDTLTKVIEFKPMREALDTVGAGLDLLTEIVGNLKIEDATVRTRILENISEVFAQLNRSKALLENRRKSLMSTEAVAEFGAEFMLFSQSVQSALAMCDTPEKADEQLSRILVQLEELEGRFSEFDQFVGELAQKREEVHDAFEARKQTLLEERQRRANTLATAADRILGGIARRALAFRDVTDLHAYFAADAMVLKVRDVVEKLRQLGESVRADDVEARLKSSRDQAIRALRDKLEIFDEGGAVIKLGRHRFSVNTQPLDLTLLPRDETLVAHLTGTDFFEPLEDGELSQLREFWEQEVLSETRAVYRGEYLAASLLFAAANGSDGASLGA
ncbi:MAG: DNA repair ATPase, partial [Myxococcales bacterium]|nr:DNA repair ATPase [Myxococcales bacterium]